MEAEKSTLELKFESIELKISNSNKLTVQEKRKELAVLDHAIAELELLFDRFQMIGYSRYPKEIDQFEERLNRLKNAFKRVNDDGVSLSQAFNEPGLES